MATFVLSDERSSAGLRSEFSDAGQVVWTSRHCSMHVLAQLSYPRGECGLCGHNGGNMSIEFTGDAPDDDQPRLGAGPGTARR